MRRFAKKTKLEEFKKLFYDAWNSIEADNEYYRFRKFITLGNIIQDLKKVDFGFNNFSFKEKENTLMGFNYLYIDLSFLGCWAHDYNDKPVFFIIYHDGNEFRAYIPEWGNVYNDDLNSAFGKHKEEDVKNIYKNDVRFVRNIIKDGVLDFDSEKWNWGWGIEDSDKIKEEISNKFDLVLSKIDYDYGLIERDILKNFEMKETAVNPRLEKRPTWDQYFVAICEVTKARSLDPNTQVGSVIIDKNNRIVSTGYNSFPAGCRDEDLPFGREGSNSKYNFIVHADMGAVINAKRDLTDCIIYLPFMPCPDCFKAIIASGIKHIKYYGIYESGVNKDEDVRRLANMLNIKLEKINVNIPKIIWN